MTASDTPSTAHGGSTIAYFSMEIALEQAIPTYSGGLGVLAGDTLRSGADLGLPMVAVTLLYRKGYFSQHLDAQGNQTESPRPWSPEQTLTELPARVSVEVAGRTVHLRAWQYSVRGVSGHEVPVYLLDSALPENDGYDQTLTDALYGGDNHYRLCQELVLGVGGAAMLRALGIEGEIVHHINEGHASLLTLALLERQLEGRGAWDVTPADTEAVRRQVVFTTHTPVPAGHDKFAGEMARQILGAELSALLDAVDGWEEGQLHMTHLALRFARFTNAVAMRHQEVSATMFPGHQIAAITNGVHAPTWTAAAFRDLFDRHIPEWRRDNQYLRYAVTIPLDEIRAAHAQAKGALLEEIQRRTGVAFDPAVMTVGFARRATPYKRADLIFTDLERLRAVTRHTGPIQVVYGGKAHPHDQWGKDLIRRIFTAADQLRDEVRVVYLENYEMSLGHLITSGCDLWLNNPLRPLEASGTSGMKAALNGVPSLSVIDGWWVEGCVEGTTGWAIGADARSPQDAAADSPDLYYKLERIILPMFYGLPYRYADVMRNAIALNGSFFNTQRMVTQYVHNAYFPRAAREVNEQGVLV